MLGIPLGPFPNNCAEAHKLYQKAFGMTINSVTYRDEFPEHCEPLTDETRKSVLHSECSIYGTRVNMSDYISDEFKPESMRGFNVFLSSEDDVRKVFNVLKEGGVVESEPQPVFWSSLHCCVKDRFGVVWQIMIDHGV